MNEEFLRLAAALVYKLGGSVELSETEMNEAYDFHIKVTETGWTFSSELGECEPVSV